MDRKKVYYVNATVSDQFNHCMSFSIKLCLATDMRSLF